MIYYKDMYILVISPKWVQILCNLIYEIQFLFTYSLTSKSKYKIPVLLQSCHFLINHLKKYFAHNNNTNKYLPSIFLHKYCLNAIHFILLRIFTRYSSLYITLRSLMMLAKYKKWQMGPLVWHTVTIKTLQWEPPRGSF